MSKASGPCSLKESGTQQSDGHLRDNPAELRSNSLAEATEASSTLYLE